MQPNLVVRTYAPVRRFITMGVGVLLAIFSLYAAYELGRFDAGYDRMAASQQRTELEVEIGRLEKSNRDLRTQLAALETMRVGHERERAEVARTIVDLQGRLARQQQDLAFYRGIVTQSAGALGVKIQQLRIENADAPRRYRVRLTLVQAGRPDSAVSGTLSLKVDGAAGGSTAAHELPFNFRYYENFEQEIALPEGFTPEKVTVVVRATRKGVTPLTQTFPWKVDAG